MHQSLVIDAAAASAPSCNLCGGRSWRPLFRKVGYDLVECTGCGLAYIANPPDAATIAALYDTAESYHAALLDPSHQDFRRMRRIARQHLRFLHRSIPRPEGVRLLDVGCSTGLFLNEARTAGFSVHGAELSTKSARFAREHFGLDVHPGDWREAGHADHSFDVITLFDVIEHLADPHSELVALRRLLKPGGVLLQSTPDIDGLFPRLSYRLVRKLDYWPHPEPPHHLYQFSKRTLTALTETAGYAPARADRTRIGLSYSFGGPASWRSSPKMLAYAALFAPSAVIGDWIGRGDWLYLAARKPANG
jgi:2-polyprenyl-3-methyl-5-hydroxy-6-metoxy-1,4-benzoquinol methylase